MWLLFFLKRQASFIQRLQQSRQRRFAHAMQFHDLFLRMCGQLINGVYTMIKQCIPCRATQQCQEPCGRVFFFLAGGAGRAVAAFVKGMPFAAGA